MKHALALALIVAIAGPVACKGDKKPATKSVDPDIKVASGSAEGSAPALVAGSAEGSAPAPAAGSGSAPAAAKGEHGWLVVVACDEAQGDVRQKFLPPAVVKKSGVSADFVKEIDGDETLVKLLEGWESRERGMCTVVHVATEAEAKTVAGKFEGTTVGAAREKVPGATPAAK